MKIDYSNSPNFLKDFYNYLIITKNYSVGTAEEYYRSILYFLKFIKEIRKLDIEIKDFEIFIILSIEQADIISFMIFLNSYRNNNAKTRNLRLAALKTFFKYIYQLYPMYCKNKMNPVENIDYSYTTYRLPKYLNLKEAKKLCNIFNDKNCKDFVRNNLIIYLFLVTGLRKSELIGLNINDINFNENIIRVLGKGNKERTLFITNVLKEKILKYLEIRNIKDLESFKPLFVSSGDKRISKSTVRYIVNRAYEIAGLKDKKLTVHSLRHTAATIMYEETNGDILIVKKFLGHSSIESTQIYTHVINKELKQAYNSNPLANFKA